jgi:hypothetical protein
MSAAPALEPPYVYIRDRLMRGKVIPFLGAGASLIARQPGQSWSSPDCAFLPKTDELARYLEEKSNFPSDALPELTRVAQYFDGVNGRGGLDEVLHEVFAKSYQPGPLHHFLAEFSNLLIVTTNYDDLLERAFQAKGKPYHVLVYNSANRADASGDKPEAAPAILPAFTFWEYGKNEPQTITADDDVITLGTIPVIFKMHGAPNLSNSEKDSYVITEDDYVEFLSRMASNTAIPKVFAEPFRKCHFLFLGYGLQDWNLRVILHKIWRDWPNRNFASWAIQNHAQQLEREFWSKRRLTIYEMAIDEFLTKIR